MNKKNLIKEIVVLVFLLVPIIFMFIVWDKLPEKLPVHWNIKGEIDNYGAKYLYAIINAALYIVFLVIPKIDPRKKNYTIFSVSYYKLRFIITLFFSLLFFMVMYNALYSYIAFDKIFPVGFLFLFALIGNYFGTIRSNYFIGVRTPWTLNNDEVWKRTHVLAGRLWVYCGIIGGLICLFLNMQLSQYFAVGLIVIMVLVPIIYSYIYYQKVVKRNVEV
jgi:uncharacterized membrane protein